MPSGSSPLSVNASVWQTPVWVMLHQHFAGARRFDVDLDDLQRFACGEGDGGA